MKKLTRILCLLLAAFLLTACSEKAEPPAQTEPEDDTLSILTSFYPIYAVAVNILDGVPDMQLSCLVQPQDGCLRNYRISDLDAALIASCDGIIIGGKGLESFEGALGSLENGPAVIYLLDGLTLKNNGKNADSDEATHMDGDNPWLFLSVSGAIQMAISLGYGMGELDEQYADLYLANMQDFVDRCEALIREMHAQLRNCNMDTPVAVIHEGLSYLTSELNLNLVCEFMRESGTDLYDNDLEALLNELEASGAKVVLAEKQLPMNLKEALTGAGYRVALIDTLTTYTADGDKTVYEKAMLNNAKAIADAVRSVE